MGLWGAATEIEHALLGGVSGDFLRLQVRREPLRVFDERPGVCALRQGQHPDGALQGVCDFLYYVNKWIGRRLVTRCPQRTVQTIAEVMGDDFCGVLSLAAAGTHLL